MKSLTAESKHNIEKLRSFLLDKADYFDLGWLDSWIDDNINEFIKRTEGDVD